MNVKIKRLSQNAIVPKYAKDGDAGLDLTATSYEYKGGRHYYGTDLAVAIPKGYVGLLYPRSSIIKYDLRLANSVGVIDSGYRGEIKVVFENQEMGTEEFMFSHEDGENHSLGKKTNIYKIGERIAQLIIVPYPQVQFEEVGELDETKRGDGGFGSSGAW